MDLSEEKQLLRMLDYLGRYCTEIDAAEPHHKNVDVNTLPIWQFWERDVAEAPALIKRCFESVERHCGGRPIGTVTPNTYRAAGIELPDYIVEKANQGAIPSSHFADILNMCLLEKYGGTWVDATVFLSGPIPQAILDEPFFAFRTSTDNVFSARTLFSNWFIHAQPNHVFIRNLKQALFSYWKRENTLINYFLLHYLSYRTILPHPTLAAIWMRCSHYSNSLSQTLNGAINGSFNKADWGQLKNEMPIHKLSLKHPEPAEGSYLQALLDSEADFL